VVQEGGIWQAEEMRVVETEGVQVCRVAIALCAPSRMRAYPGPGIGCAPDPDRLAERQIETAVIG
jgi:hypothetical protein